MSMGMRNQKRSFVSFCECLFFLIVVSGSDVVEPRIDSETRTIVGLP